MRMERTGGKARIMERKLQRPRLQVTYPQIAGGRSAIADKMINQVVLETVYRMIREQGIMADYTKTGTGVYEVKLNDKGLVSLVLENYTYAKGAAHGLTLRKSLTGDLGTGRIYQLDDFFLEGSHYNEFLSDIIKRQFKEKDILQTTPFESLSSDPDFYLTEKDLVIYFQQYEYTPYVVGFPEFEIPYRNLNEIVDPKGPLARLMK